jgi:hypothetical protein
MREPNISQECRREAISMLDGLINKDSLILLRNGIKMHQEIPDCLTAREKPAGYFTKAHGFTSTRDSLSLRWN